MRRLNPVGRETEKLNRLEREQEHLARWLDQQINALGVGLNDEIQRNNQEKKSAL